MVFAAVGDGVYNVFLLLHIVAVLVAFSPAVAHTLLAAQVRGGRGGAPVLGLMHRNERRVNAPALVLAGLLGFGLQGMSDGAWEFGQTWIWLSIVLWIVQNGVLHAVLLPAQKAVADGDRSGQSRVDLGSGLVSLLFLVILILMIWKPGA